jgi:hypothetical protein
MIKLSKLKEGNKVLLETKESIFEVEILNPNTGRIQIVGSRRFPHKTKARIVGSHNDKGDLTKLEIHQNAGLEIEYKEGTVNHQFVTSPVISARVSGEQDGKHWSYEVWEKPDIRSAVDEARKRT